MKRLFLLTLLCLASCYEPAREASEMPTPYTPNPANNPAVLSLPNAGEPVASAIADQAWKDVADRGAFVAAHTYAGPSALAAIADAIENERRFVKGYGLFQYNAASLLTPDSILAVTATGMGGGVWSHESLLSYVGATSGGVLKGVAYIGPTPADSLAFLASATVAGRINKQFVDHGYWSHNFNDTHQQYNTASAVAVTLVTPVNIGGLIQNDIVEFYCNSSIYGNSAANFVAQIWTEYSLDNGGSYTQITGLSGSAYSLTAANANDARTPQLNFTKVIPMGGAPLGFRVRIRALTVGGNQIILDVDSFICKVMRP